MRPLERIPKLLKELERVWTKSPDLRFGQLLINLGIAPDSLELWQLESSDILKVLKNVKW